MNQYELSEFPIEVIEILKMYVYRLIDPRNGITFYIGKGKGNRVFHHIKGALASEEIDELNDKIQTIREINTAGLDVIHVIHRHGMDEDTAVEVEAALIDAFPEVTNIMGATGSNDFGPMNAIKIVNKYAAEEAVFEHNVLMITINKMVSERSIYDATRFCWKLSFSKLEKVDYVLAVVQGIIVEVFEPITWKKATQENFPEFNDDVPSRIGFEGKKAEEEIVKLYIRKRVPAEYRKGGAANPIKYSF